MAARKRPPTAFGLDILLYCAKNGITQRQLADQAGVSYETMKDAARGKRPGYEVIKNVRKIIPTPLGKSQIPHRPDGKSVRKSLIVMWLRCKKDSTALMRPER